MDSILNGSNTPKYFNSQYYQFKNNFELDTKISQMKRGKDLFPLNDTDPNRILSSAFNGKAEEE